MMLPLDHLPHLFVEGKTDKYVVIHLLESHNLFAQDGESTKRPDDLNRIDLVVKIVKPNEASSGSKSELLKDLSLSIRSPKHRAIGYIFDADDPAFTASSLKQTWQAICERLSKPPACIQSPDSIPAEGFVGHHSKTKTPIGVWLMPDNQRDGSLEDFLRELIDDGDTLAPFAETSTRSAKDDHGALFGEKDFKKAVMNT